MRMDRDFGAFGRLFAFGLADRSRRRDRGIFEAAGRESVRKRVLNPGRQTAKIKRETPCGPVRHHRAMETILKLKSDGAQVVLTIALVAACSLNAVFVAAFVAVRSDRNVEVASVVVGGGNGVALRLRADDAAVHPTNRPGNAVRAGRAL
jgi:hypothetical protein